MKAFVLFAVLCGIFVVATEARTSAQRLADERQWFVDCRDKAGATDEDIEGILNRIVPTNRNAKCMLACVHEFLLMSKNGKLNMPGVNAIAAWRYDDLNLLDVFELIGDCNSVKDDPDRCEFAAKYMQCIVNSARNRGVDLKNTITPEKLIGMNPPYISSVIPVTEAVDPVEPNPPYISAVFAERVQPVVGIRPWYIPNPTKYYGFHSFVRH